MILGLTTSSMSMFHIPANGVFNVCKFVSLYLSTWSLPHDPRLLDLNLPLCLQQLPIRLIGSRMIFQWVDCCRLVTFHHNSSITTLPSNTQTLASSLPFITTPRAANFSETFGSWFHEFFNIVWQRLTVIFNR